MFVFRKIWRAFNDMLRDSPFCHIAQLKSCPKKFRKIHGKILVLVKF